MAECAKGFYRPRHLRETAFYRLVEQHYEKFEQVYPERYEDRYGFFRSVIRETVYKYLNCGDLKQGFARVRCRDCGHEFSVQERCPTAQLLRASRAGGGRAVPGASGDRSKRSCSKRANPSVPCLTRQPRPAPATAPPA